MFQVGRKKKKERKKEAVSKEAFVLEKRKS